MHIALILGLMLSTASASDDVTVLHYYERPPFMTAQPDGSAKGLTADAAAALFRRAQVRFRWQLTPAKRQLSEIESDTGPDCGIGWFANGERARYGELIGPIYQDKPPVVLAGAGFPVDFDKPIEQLLAESKLPILVKDGLSYGSYVSRLIAERHLPIQRLTIEQVQMARMLVAGRASFMFSTREEAEMLLAGNSMTPGVLRVIDLTTDSVGEGRYLLCSRRVDPQIILALKAALTS